jgi:hypothetical protein
MSVIQLNQPPVVRDLSSNIVSLQNTRNLAGASALQALKGADLCFPVELVPLETIAPGYDGMGQQAVVRLDTQEVLKVHGSRYNLIKNEVVFGGIDDMIRHSDQLDTNGMRITDQIAYGGGRSMRTYVFPEHQVKINSGAEAREGDITQLRINIINSYNGDTNLRINVGGLRLICLNGMVVGDIFGSFRSQHTAGFRPDEIAPRIAAALDNFHQVGAKWKVWAGTECSTEMASRAISKLAGKSESLHNKLMVFWHNESVKMGNTVWALYNALTFWSTHHEIASRSQHNSSAIVQDRELRVMKVLQLPMFSAVA